MSKKELNEIYRANEDYSQELREKEANRDGVRSERYTKEEVQYILTHNRKF